VRIISGTYRGKIINAPASLPVRPTTDFAKTALFNILQFKVDFESVKVLDLFAGTGNISYEFFSRGSTDITCVDMNQHCVNFIRETFLKLKFEKAKVYKSDVFRFLKDHDIKYDVIFADPPFEMQQTSTIPDIIFEKKLLKPNGWLIVEHQSSDILGSTIAPDEERKYGNVGFSIYRNV
jgi:16S rRNA (guanine966-N2)-methyltransferase